MTVGGRRLLATASVVALAASLAACGGGSGGSGNEGTGTKGGTVILGTTDKVTSLDPSGGYDLGSWTLMSNMYQLLVHIRPGGNTPESDAADCNYTDPQTYKCTLKDGLKFSNGHDLTSEDVKFSFDRMVKINDPNGPATLFGSMQSVDAPDAKTVVFHLNKPDATFAYVLTTAAAAIVDSEVFPADKLLDSEQAVGSGPYKLDKYQKDQQAVFSVNKNYKGDVKPKNSQFIVQYFAQPSALKLAIQQGDVDVAYRSLSPTDINDLRNANGVNIVEGAGTEIRYMTWYLKSKVGGNKAVRQAVAQVLDRAAIAKNAYDDTVTPLYSLVPVGLQGHIDAFKDQYGEPSVDKAKQILSAAGVTTPVPLTIGWTPSHYGPNLADEYTEIKRQLEASGLFTVKLASAEWEQYQNLYKEGAYDAFALGWFPDFPDADNYSSPFLRDGGFYANGYSSPQMNQLLDKEVASTDQNERNQIFGDIQKLTAQDVPVIPVWQGKQIAAVRDGVSGVKDTFDPSFTFRFALVSKG